LKKGSSRNLKQVTETDRNPKDIQSAWWDTGWLWIGESVIWQNEIFGGRGNLILCLNLSMTFFIYQ